MKIKHYKYKTVEHYSNNKQYSIVLLENGIVETRGDRVPQSQIVGSNKMKYENTQLKRFKFCFLWFLILNPQLLL